MKTREFKAASEQMAVLLQCGYQFDASFSSNEKSDPKAAQIAIICLLYLGEYLFREDACYRNTA